MSKKQASLSTFFHDLSSRIDTAKHDINRIERERLLTPEDKLVPVYRFLLTLENDGAHKNTLTRFQKKSRKLRVKLAHTCERAYYKREFPLYEVATEILPQELQDDANRIQADKELDFQNRVNKALELAGQKPNPIKTEFEPVPFIHFMHLGHLLVLRDRLDGNDEFWLTTRLSAFHGEAKADLKTWQAINALKDYSDYFTHSNFRPRRKKKLQPKAAANPAWASAPVPVKI